MGGECECESNRLCFDELKNVFNRNKEIPQNEIEFIKREKRKSRIIIKTFIKKNILRLYNKEKNNNIINKSQNLFIEKEELNFIYNKMYYQKKLNSKITDFFKKKENIVEDLFLGNLIGSLHSFPKLRDKISTYHNNNILINQKEYLNDLIIYLTEHNLINKKLTNSNMVKYLLDRITLNEVVNDENNKRNKVNRNTFRKHNVPSLLQKNNLKEKENINNENNYIKNTITYNQRVEFGSNNNKVKFNIYGDSMDVENLIKREIDNFFDICFGSTKKNFLECQKKSIFLNIIISEENKKNPQINFIFELRKLIKLLYYIYLLKKYNYISDTNNIFYKINPLLIKRKSVLKDKIILDKNESFFKNEILKIKLLKSALSSTINEPEISLNLNIADSESSILSEEHEKEDNSLYASVGLNLVKTLTKIEDNKLKIEEEKINDNNESKGEIEIFPTTKRKKNSLQYHIQRPSNLKIDKKVRKNKRTNTDNKTKNITEYYNGQYDGIIYAYAGLGTLVNQNFKRLYYGTFRYGKKEGMGLLYTCKDTKGMEYFMGEFHKNKIKGFGIKIKVNDTEFVFQEGIFEGEYMIKGKQKKIKIKENRIFTYNYEGEMEKNKYIGKGLLTEKRYIYRIKDNFYSFFQEINYNGEFVNGKKNGKGKEILTNIIDHRKNYEYEGNFINGLKDGYGIINYEEENFVKRYEGFFKKDKAFQIYGIVDFKSGDKYEGFLENGIKDFLGMYSFYDNTSKKFIEKYFGGYSFDSKNGIGRTFVEDGKENKMMIGTYKKGEKEGKFQVVIFRSEILEKFKQRRNCILEENLLTTARNTKREEIPPRFQTIKILIYEENEIVDIEDFDNFFNIY